MHPQDAALTGKIDFTEDMNRGKLALITMNLFERWDLRTNEQLTLLGLSENSRSLLSKYRKGEPLPSNRDIMDRVGWLLAIHKALRLFYPKNEDIRYTWIKRRNTAFDNRTPLELMLEDGLIGISKISRYLDHQRGL